MQLAAVVHGPATTRPPLLIAHGLFGSARNWGAIAKRLALHRQVIAVDMRNHGDSPRSPDHGYRALAGDLAATIAAHGGCADVLGHSMGGKAAMVLALTEPDRVRRLIVADMAPVAYGHSQIGYVRAMQARRPRHGRPPLRRRRRAGRRAFPTRRSAPSCCRASPSTDGRAAWKLNLPALADADAADHGLPRPRRPLRPADAVPDRRPLRLRPPGAWPRIRALFPAARHVELAGAGHWLHADAPGRVRRGSRGISRNVTLDARRNRC